MARITSYATLQDEVTDYLARGDFTASDIQGFIQLAEATMNREINAITKDATLTGTIGSKTIDVSSLSIDEPIALWVTDNNDEIQVTKKSNGSFPQSTVNARPTLWAIDNDTIEFNCPCSEAFTFRFVYDERFELSDSVTTNWVLENHPDIYLQGACAYGRAKESDGNSVQNWLSWFKGELPRVKRSANKLREGQLQVDPALTYQTRYGGFDHETL